MHIVQISGWSIVKKLSIFFCIGLVVFSSHASAASRTRQNSRFANPQEETMMFYPENEVYYPDDPAYFPSDQMMYCPEDASLFCPTCNSLPCDCPPAQPEVSLPIRQCAPCAPVCGTDCGVSICAVVIAIAAVVAAGAIILASGETENVH